VEKLLLLWINELISLLFAVLLQKRNQLSLGRIPLLSWQYCLLRQLIPNSRKNEPFIYFSLEYTLDIKKIKLYFNFKQ
jgi:hypothetical protein